MFNYINRGPIPSLKSGSSKKTIPIILVANEDLKKWQQSLSNNQQSWLKLNDFNATSGEILLFIANNGAVDFVAAGMGENNSSTIEQDPIEPWLFSKIAKSVPKGTYQISNILNDRDANSAAFGWAMAHYKFSVYLKETKQKLSILTVPKNCDINFVSHMVRGSTLCRDLVNTPTCHMGPDDLGEVSKSLAREFKAKITIITGAALLKAGFNTIHTVGRAAEKEPRLIDITWGNQKAPKITLVGKGVCFDTGGLDIKPSNSMLNMKKDMGGAAHVLGLGQMIMEAGLNVRLRILIPAVENNISANAFRPGDIIKSYHGTTIEIGNTDAEGRLVLCDALALASEENPDLLMDFATLTGAARVALGTDVPPYFTDDQSLNSELLSRSKNQCDPLWPLPLYDPYKELLSSSIADLNNVASTGLGGAITAALFLKHFVPKTIPWIHFDVYAWNDRERPGRPKGGEAMGIRSVFDYLATKFKS